MEENPDQIDTLVRRIKELGLTYIELLKLQAVDRITTFISGIIPDLIISGLFIFFLLFVNLGLAFWLGDVFGKVYLGFLALAGLYFTLCILSHFFMRGWFKKMAANYFIKQFFR